MLDDNTQKLFSQLSDRELLLRVVENDHCAIEYFFFHKYFPIFQRLSSNIFKNQIEVLELVNEFYIDLQKNNWSKLKSFEEKSKLSTWLTIVASRFFIKKKEKMKQLDEKTTMNIEDFIDELVVEASVPITHADLYDAINRLKNSKYRWVLLSELQGFTPEEMSKEMGTSVGNIYNYKKRGKIALVELLNERKDG